MKFKTVENEFGEKFYKTFARCIARDPWINETHAWRGFFHGLFNFTLSWTLSTVQGSKSHNGALVRDGQ